MALAEIVRDSQTILLVDWPDRDVPDTLARAGYTVVSHDGPGEDDYNAYEMVNGDISVRHVGRPPVRVDLVYTHRPLEELAGIAEQARSLGARAVWMQSGRDGTGAPDARGTWLSDADAAQARSIVEGVGLEYVDAPYIADAVRAITRVGSGGGEA